jgi:DNA-binding NtrC family response regulator
MMKDKIMIVEDELIVANDIRRTLERNGFKIAGIARTMEKALQIIEDSRPSLALLDIFLKGTHTGIDLAEHLNDRQIPFIFISANSNQQVLEAVKLTNPFGFIVKPFREKDLLITIDIAIYRYENNKRMGIEAKTADRFGSKSLYTSTHFSVNSGLAQNAVCGNIIGRSAPMLQLFNLIEQVAPFDSSVLVLGESGTGKEGIANCIVQQSKRSKKPYIKINCAAIPADLMESELFGHEKGAFTGAIDRKIGKFELASGGTILLDEVGEIRPEMQAKLLRVLQEKEIQRIGSNAILKIDVRVLAATSRILEKEVAEGRFRLDLYYRLLVFPITLPPLRGRREDIPLLIDHFTQYYSDRTGKIISAFHPDAVQKLLRYDWPGNVRELQHVIERSILLAKDDIVREVILPDFIPDPSIENKKDKPVKTLEEMERDHIIKVLHQCEFRISGKGGAADLLNLPPSTLHSKIKKLGIRINYE